MKKIIPIIILFILIFPINVSALDFKNPVQWKEIQQIIYAVVSFIYALGLVATPLMIVIAGFVILTAGDNPEKVKQGRHIIVYAMIGLFIILFAKGIISILNNVMGV
jgi:hypothetical protein